MGFNGSRDHEHRCGSDWLEGLDRAARRSQPKWNDDDAQLQFFDVDSDGKFARVIIWMDGTNPLK